MDRQGNQQLREGQPLIFDDLDDPEESEAVTNLKLSLLFLLTFGLIAVIYVISTVIQQVKGPFNVSYQVGGGIMLGLFGAYIISFGTCWLCNSRRRDKLRRKVEQRAIVREKAMRERLHFQ